jgi:prepilin-type N-terminal cleavage/methylation domain-containing protein
MTMRTELYGSRKNPSVTRGFTLVELLITLTVLAMVMGIVAAMVYIGSKSKQATSTRIESAQGARVALDMIANDLRSAGYGADITHGTPQPQIAYIDSTQVLINANLSNWPDTATVTFPVPRAYDPSGNPRPKPLDGTAWQPPVKYRTGAEVIRYTLDANNDGSIDNDDLADAVGALAARTKNPNDFVLLREVFGDSVGGVAGNNGGATQEIALVRAPGGTIPPMYTVYLRGSSTPWNWANGPIPVNRLNDVERITLQVTAASSNADSKGRFAETTLRTEVNSMRNVPNFGGTQYSVSGYVYEDKNGDQIMNSGEPGLANVRVTLGKYTAFTGQTGAFLFRVFAGTYTLRHTPPAGYNVSTTPDSFVVTVNNAVTRSFADVSIPGGEVIVNVFEDKNDNRAYDPGEPPVPTIRATLSPGGQQAWTDANGNVRLFSPPGSFTVALALPDSYAVNTTPYPLTGTMADNDSASFQVGIERSVTGTVAGKVFRDNNRDGIAQGGEPGLSGVWVGVTNDGGATILGYAYTGAGGDYSIDVPINDPPRSTPYAVFVIPPPGDFPTTPTSRGGLWVQASGTTPGLNFGMAAYTIITLNASRVLSLATADMIEKDWNGNQFDNAVGDMDLVLGADAGSTDNISVWLNRYTSTPLFGANPSGPDGYSRLAPQSVLSIAVDTLDSNPTWRERPDIVTGTKIAPAGNLFVWINQNTSGNYGILPASYTTGMNYRTNDGGDVQSVLTMDVIGGDMPDIIAGTKSVTAYQGSIEIWQHNNGTTPGFNRVELYPNAGSIPGNKLGEVNALFLADLDNDGLKDLVAGTRTSSLGGEIVVFQNMGKSSGSSRFECRAVLSCPLDQITALAVFDLDGDGNRDILAGTHTSLEGGNLMIWRNYSTIGTNWSFVNTRTVNADGIVMSLAIADFGGSPRMDLAVGTRATPTGYVGGVEIFYTDVMGLPPVGTDPSSGSIGNMVPALTKGNYNAGLNPPVAPPYLTDLACGVKISASTGAIVVFIR